MPHYFFFCAWYRAVLVLGAFSSKIIVEAKPQANYISGKQNKGLATHVVFAEKSYTYISEGCWLVLPSVYMHATPPLPSR